jgi:pentose-5-phosphate-3-epimerase
MTTPNHAPPGWLNDLPRHRLLAEYSLWSADLANLERDIRHTEAYADIYHIDVADGRCAAGAETVVLGSLAFRAPDLAARTNWLHNLPAPAVA